jgi:hypothetical protein
MMKPNRLARVLLLLLALSLLILGLAAGLMRLGWNLSWTQPKLASDHGPLMVCGFLGTLISLERAVALGRKWAYLAPLLAAIGSIDLVAGSFVTIGILLIVLASVVLACIFIAVLFKQPSFHSTTMGLGAGAWIAGNVLWIAGVGIPHMIHWWIGFLILTIAGERLELNRLLAPARHARSIFASGLILFLAGLICASIFPIAGDRVAGGGMLALALWLARFDVARFTVRQPGLPRFIAANLLAGYVWLAVGGLIWLFAVPIERLGNPYLLVYDAMIHSIFLGFVFSMIFAHAPIIFPAVVGRPMAFRRFFYAHAVVLHVSLIARVASDLTRSFVAFRWAGLGNLLAVLLFFASSVYGMIAARRATRLSPA